jgi:hypothetical protein
MLDFSRGYQGNIGRQHQHLRLTALLAYAGGHGDGFALAEVRSIFNNSK